MLHALTSPAMLDKYIYQLINDIQISRRSNSTFNKLNNT